MSNLKPKHPWSNSNRGSNPLKIVYTDGTSYVTGTNIVSPKKYMESVQPNSKGNLPEKAFWVRNGVTDTNPCWTN